MDNRLILTEIEVNKKKYYYTYMGEEYHGRPSFKLWVHPSLVKKQDDTYYIELPILKAKIDKGKKENNYIIRPDDKYWIAHIFYECGYRGGSTIEPKIPQPVFMVKYNIYHSPTGSLGVSEGALLVYPITEKTVYISAERSGRLKGLSPYSLFELNQNGTIKEIDNISDIEDLPY